MRLCELAATRWPQIDAAYYQVNLLRLPPHRFLNMVYSWAIPLVPPDDMENWLRDLHDLLPWQTSTSAAAEAAESDSFFAMMNG